MVITWHGKTNFKIQAGETVLVIDPTSKGEITHAPRFRSDIVLLTQQATTGEKPADNAPFIISGPGEYEARSIVMTGAPVMADENNGRDRGLATCYRLVWEDMRLAHMGAWRESALRGDTEEHIGSVDILFIPIENPAASAKAVREIEPSIVVPMNFDEEPARLKAFAKEMNMSAPDPEEKLVIKKKDLAAGCATKIVVLKAV
ncbi:MAG: MBL fold metallo-hydrolase [Patescibacteria group bacterium]